MSALKRKKAVLAPQRTRHRLRLWLNLLRTTRFIEATVREKLRQTYGSTLPRFDVMSTLERNPKGLLMSQLSQHLMVSNGNVTGIIDRLVEEKLVRRLAVVGDRRATRVVLSKAGFAAFSAMAREHEAWLDDVLKNVDHAESAYMIDLLSSIRKTSQ